MRSSVVLFVLALCPPVLLGQEIRVLREVSGATRPGCRQERLGTIADVRQLAVPLAGERVLALDARGQVHEWRRSREAEFSGDWRVLDSPGGVKAIAAGARHTLLLLEDGRVWAAGGNAEGQLGDGSLLDREVFRRVGTLPEITGIAAGSNFGLALDSAGRVWAWGSNWTGVIPGDSRKLISQPVVVSGIPKVENLIVRADAPFARDGKDVWTWGLVDPEKRTGQNANGRLLAGDLLTILKQELSSGGSGSKMLWWPGLEGVSIGVSSRRLKESRRWKSFVPLRKTLS